MTDYTVPTPRPWKSEEEEPYYLVIRGPLNQRIARVYLDDAPVEDYNQVQHINADFIVRAVNAHDDLIAALELAKPFLTASRGVPFGPINALARAILKAEGRL